VLLWYTDDGGMSVFLKKGGVMNYQRENDNELVVLQLIQCLKETFLV